MLLASVVSGADLWRSQRSSQAVAAVATDPYGALDGVSVTLGAMRIQGWAIDPSTTGPVVVVVNNGSQLLTRIRADKLRTDVEQAHPGFGANHGFDSTITVAEGTYSVCVYAVNVGPGTVNTTLGCKRVVYNNKPSGSLDTLNQLSAGRFGITGGATDPNTTAPINVDVLMDGRVLTRVLANQSGHHGHAYLAIVGGAQGTHTICARGVNVGLGSGDGVLGCKTITLNYNPIGALQALNQVPGGFHLAGWASDPDVASPIWVAVYVDGRRLAQAQANRANGVAGHGFDRNVGLTQGVHTICVYGMNVSAGTVNTLLGCRRINLNFNPVGTINSIAQTANGIRVIGWSFDPDRTAPIQVAVYADGKGLGWVTANLSRPDVARTYPAAGALHGFDGSWHVGQGTHTICVYGINVGAGSGNPRLSCKAVTLNFNPRGAFESAGRTATATPITVVGWAADPNTTAPIVVQVTVDGKVAGRARAELPRTDLAAKMAGVGANHGYRVTTPATDTEHRVCVSTFNVLDGNANPSLGCRIVNAVHPKPPSPPRSATATAGYASARVRWVPPLVDGGAPTGSYTVTASPGGASTTVPASARTAVVTGLRGNTRYAFNVTANNVAGASVASRSNVIATPNAPPPQTTPAPISTSRYIRNINGAASDLTTMRAEGVTDAAHNPSGHSYLVLLDIGGQDYAGNGVVLSATTRFVSNAKLVAAMNAYVDGYASRQLPVAPVVIAVGTNNDMDVSAAAGAQWARNVVNPVAAHAARYASMTVAGANDIEPGFSASAASSRAWLTGYLGATTRRFVFNGSADGCNWTAVNGRCNNGWTAADLQWLAGGAASNRIVNLPQIYNTTMAQQWKYISLTGVAGRRARINFGGPLTEWTACAQAGSCGSLTGNSAWTAMWNALRSDSRISQPSLSWSTDLRIN